MSIPAVEPPIVVPPGGLPPGTTFGRTAWLDDSAGSGIVIPLGQVDDQYVQWRITGDLPGWDSADLEEQAEAMVGADGSWDALNYFAGRQITIEGLIKAPDAVTLEAARYRLAQAVPARRLITFRVDETVPKYVTCRRTGRLLMSDQTDTVAAWTATLLAPDPRKYAVDATQITLSIAQAAAGVTPPLTPPIVFPDRPPGVDTATITNSGTAETQPLIRVDGPGADLTLYQLTLGLRLAYDVVLGPSDYLLIDTHAGIALLNGSAPRSPVAGSAITSQWVLAPGANQIRFAGTPTDPDLVATATIQARSAWD